MEVEIIKDSKEELEVKLENLTLAELLRVYLNEDSDVTFVAWKREHITEKPILSLKVKGKTAKKAMDDAVSAVVKDLEKVEKDFGNLK